ncbi:MAG: VWA domain-containing protein [Bacteroidales bacterium]|nr:VWA domain-containing protein [Bacteroidales bacterium]
MYFKFAHPEFLWLLLVVPGIIIFYIYSLLRRKKNIEKYGNPKLLEQLMPDVSPSKPRWKFIIQTISLAFLVIVIAGPQFGSKLETVKKEGVEIMIALDISNSMLSRDIAPNRLEKAKQMLARLVDQLQNDKVGLIVFAGDAFTQLPITSDYVSAKMFLSSINPNMVSSQGTAIGAAINLAARSFTPNETSDKAIVVITDGENHEGNAVEAATAAAEKNIKVDVIGIGDPQGAPVPDDSGNVNSFKKDKEGNVVVSRLNEEMAKEIAAAGKGIYVRADNTNSALKALTDDVKKMNKTELESRVYSDYDEKFQPFAWAVLVLLLFNIFILDRKNSVLRKIKLF